MRTAEELREAFEDYLGSYRPSPELGSLEAALRYTLDSGGKRVRPVLCLAVAEAAGGTVEAALPAAAAVELVHTFSLVHDDLPALDDDAERRGRASAHVALGEGTALLAGDALLAEAFRIALDDDVAVARELVEATLAMIGGQHRDLFADEDLAEVERLKTGSLFSAAVGLGLRAARVPEREQGAWRSFGHELGAVFQLVDDLLDGDGYVHRVGAERTRALAAEATGRGHERLAEIDADTSVLAELLDGLAARTS